MPLRKPFSRAADAPADDAESLRKSRRQRIASFFTSRHRRHKRRGHDKEATATTEPNKASTPKPQVSNNSNGQQKPDMSPTRSTTSVEAVEANEAGVNEQQQPSPSNTTQPETDDTPKPQPLSEEQLQTLFSGAPHFGLEKVGERTTPRASFPWDAELMVRDVSDSVQLGHPAFSAATLRKHLPLLPQASNQDKLYLSYDAGVVEVPSMLSAQGIEPGTVGFVNFLEQPISDALVTDLQPSRSSNDFLEEARNREQMQTNPERLGIRAVHVGMIYDRLLELGDLIEVFQDSPQRMTILNNQSSGDLYAHLFGKFLTPPNYDDSADDPTGMKVQIDTLLKILQLKGIWYDFSLVEWRIRLGQILWSDSVTDGIDESATDQLWSDRGILLLQITLACELLLRLDAVTSMDPDDVKSEMRVSPDDYRGFLSLKSRKTDWDLVLARRFLDNIVIIKGSAGGDPAKTTKSGRLLGLLAGKSEPKTFYEPDIVLLPRNQARQLSGLVNFAEALQWPEVDVVIDELVGKLRIPESSKDSEQPHMPAYRHFLDPDISSSISVYGTPLATPRSARDSYFGNISSGSANSKPTPERTDSQSLKLPLSSAIIAQVGDASGNTLNVGGWLSRSYLTGLILPGEAISHFLMSTLLENDKLAIAALGDSANLYGGFVYAGRSWWSKNCIVGRVVACLEGVLECMGWISVPRVPDTLPEGWYSVRCEQAPLEQPVRITTGITAESDQVFGDSAFVPDGTTANILPEHLTLPMDPKEPPAPSIVLSEWLLNPATPELSEDDELTASTSETETHVASLTFASFSRGIVHTFALAHDVQFITSFPCSPPKAANPISKTPIIQKVPLSRSSSKRSIHSARSAGANKRLSRIPATRRSSHGFEPLLSHPPGSSSVAPTRAYESAGASGGDALGEDRDPSSVATDTEPEPERMTAHPLHASYSYEFVPVTHVLDPNFNLRFTMPARASASPAHSDRSNKSNDECERQQHPESKTVLVLDARATKDLELLGRAWCAEKGLHAVISRVERTCLACSVREARGLGVGVVLRV